MGTRRFGAVAVFATVVALFVGMLAGMPGRAMAETYDVNASPPTYGTVYYLDASGNRVRTSVMPSYFPDDKGNQYHCLEPHKDFRTSTHSSVDATTVLPQRVVTKLGMAATWCKSTSNVPADKAGIVEQVFIWKILREIGFGTDGTTVDYATEGYDSAGAYRRFSTWYDANKEGYVGHGVVLTSVIDSGAQRVARFWATQSTGNLRVVKVATGVGIPAGKTWSFTITVRNSSGSVWRTETFSLANGGAHVMNGIPIGYKYVVEESLSAVDAGRYAVTGVPANGTIASSGTVTVTGTNVRKTGAFEVMKSVDRSRIRDKGLDAGRTFGIVVQLKDESGNAVSGTFGDMTFTNGSCTLNLKDGDVKRATGVPTDYTWTVSEPSVPTGYERSDIENSSGTVSDDVTRSIVTNKQLPGWARVTKVTS